MTATQLASPASALSRRTGYLVLAGGAVVAVAANAIVATSAIAAGASADYPALKIAVFGPLTVIGVIAAYIGWRMVARRAARPAAVLRVLVPVLAVLSFVPDVALLLTGFIPGTTAIEVAALAIMHLVVLAVVLPVCLRVAPVR